MKRFAFTICLWLVVGSLLLVGCGRRNTPSTHVPTSASTPDLSGESAANNTQQSLQGRVEGDGWHLRWNTHKTDDPFGPMVPLLVANAQKGRIFYKGDGQNIKLLLQNVYARLYEQGRYVANVQADTVIADRRQHILTGEGHVRVLSRERPPNTLITANKMIWESEANRIIAEGNVHLIQFKGNSLNARASTTYETAAPRMIYHLDTGEIVATQ